jgi:hypothetical protein
LVVRQADRSMLPRVLDPCKRHSSKERAKLHRCAAMPTNNLGASGMQATLDFRPARSCDQSEKRRAYCRWNEIAAERLD